LVSGTHSTTKMKVKIVKRAYSANVPTELHSKSKLIVIVTAQERDQFAKVAKLPAIPLTLIGSISDIIIHGMAPIPREKEIM